MSDPCPDCGRDRVLVGYRHNCSPIVPMMRGPSAAPPTAGEGASVVAGLRSRIVELEAEVERLACIKSQLEAEAQAECLSCKKRQDAKTKAQKKRRAEKKVAGTL